MYIIGGDENLPAIPHSSFSKPPTNRSLQTPQTSYHPASKLKTRAITIVMKVLKTINKTLLLFLRNKLNSLQ